MQLAESKRDTKCGQGQKGVTAVLECQSCVFLSNCTTNHLLGSTSDASMAGEWSDTGNADAKGGELSIRIITALSPQAKGPTFLPLQIQPIRTERDGLSPPTTPAGPGGGESKIPSAPPSMTRGLSMEVSRTDRLPAGSRLGPWILFRGGRVSQLPTQNNFHLGRILDYKFQRHLITTTTHFQPTQVQKSTSTHSRCLTLSWQRPMRRSSSPMMASRSP